MTIRVFRRPALAARPKNLFSYLVPHFDQSYWISAFGQSKAVEPILPAEDPASFYNWSEEMVDAQGRRVVEWGLVPKGCDRAEIYDHFVEDGRWIWQVTVEISFSAPQPVLADLLSRCFNAPFAGPLPHRRAALTREGTPR